MAVPKIWGENWDSKISKKVDKITLSLTIKDIAKFWCFAIFAKNSKIQNGCPKINFGGKLALVDF